MNGVEIALGDYPPENQPWTALVITDRQALTNLLDEIKALHRENGYLEISMPCGYSQVLREHSDIPTDDLPCPCGKEERYLIRYKKE